MKNSKLMTCDIFLNYLSFNYLVNLKYLTCQLLTIVKEANANKGR